MVGRDSPVWEGDLDFRQFSCCGDEDLFPFKCAACGLEYHFMSNPMYVVTRAQWSAAGLDQLLAPGG